MTLAIRKIHYISGLFIALFVALHLTNHICGIWGADKHIAVMQLLRIFYRNPLIESVLLLAIALQIYSGLRLFVAKRKNAFHWFDKLHIWSGLYLSFFFVVHISAILVGRYVLHLDTNFYFGATGINTFPFSLFFIPYYALAIGSLFGHIAAIHRLKMRHTLFGLSPDAQAKCLLLISILCISCIFYGQTNHFKGLLIPDAYKVLVGK